MPRSVSLGTALVVVTRDGCLDLRRLVSNGTVLPIDSSAVATLVELPIEETLSSSDDDAARDSLSLDDIPSNDEQTMIQVDE